MKLYKCYNTMILTGFIIMFLFGCNTTQNIQVETQNIPAFLRYHNFEGIDLTLSMKTPTPFYIGLWYIIPGKKVSFIYGLSYSKQLFLKDKVSLSVSISKNNNEKNTKLLILKDGNRISQSPLVLPYKSSLNYIESISIPGILKFSHPVKILSQPFTDGNILHVYLVANQGIINKSTIVAISKQIEKMYSRGRHSK